MNVYLNLELSEQEKSGDDYKRYLGGGEVEWERRGRFQLELLKFFGLKPDHRLADYGCGPLRSGRYFIDYLETGHYSGYDFNRDFIEVARSVVFGTPELHSRAPKLIHKTDFLDLEGDFDFLLMFSVLNHCRRPERSRLVEVARTLRADQKIIVTHAKWIVRWTPDRLNGLNMRLYGPDDLPASLGILDWGWEEKHVDRVFPILELTGPAS